MNNMTADLNALIMHPTVRRLIESQTAELVMSLEYPGIVYIICAPADRSAIATELADVLPTSLRMEFVAHA